MPITIEDINNEAANKPYMAKCIAISWPAKRLQSTIVDSPKIQAIIQAKPEFLENFICDYDEIKGTITSLYNAIPKPETVKPEKVKHICGTCNKVCNNKFNLESHEVVCKDKAERKAKSALMVYSCDKCGKTFDNDYNKRAHMMGSRCKPVKPVTDVKVEQPAETVEQPAEIEQPNLITPIKPRKLRSRINTPEP